MEPETADAKNIDFLEVISDLTMNELLLGCDSEWELSVQQTWSQVWYGEGRRWDNNKVLFSVNSMMDRDVNLKLCHC